jgi:hypothetical protein
LVYTFEKDVLLDKKLTITYENIHYYGEYNFNQSSKGILKYNVYLLVDDEFMNYVTQQHKYDEKTTIFIPKEEYLYNFLIYAVGEYSLVNDINIMAIYPTSQLICQSKTLEQLDEDLEKIYNNPLNFIKRCNRCEYTEYNTELFNCVRCQKKYYCDRICQRADWKFHKLICQSK